MTPEYQSRKPLIIAVCLGIAALLAGLYLGDAKSGKTPPALQTATLYPDTFRPLADFELSDQSGQTFTKTNLQNRWSLLFFGFTYCPDICPMTLTVLRQVDSALEKQGIDGIQTILVSVDPQRDTPPRLKEYIEFFDPRFIGLTDTTPEQTQLAALAGSLGVYYGRANAKADDKPDENYLVDHSAGIFLIDPQSRAFALFSAPHDAEAIARDMITILKYAKYK